MVKPKKILVPTDFSEHSNRAFERALDVAKQNDSEVVLLHVIDQDIQACTVDYCLTEDEVTKMEKRVMENAKNSPEQKRTTKSALSIIIGKKKKKWRARFNQMTF